MWKVVMKLGDRTALLFNSFATEVDEGWWAFQYRYDGNFTLQLP